MEAVVAQVDSALQAGEYAQVAPILDQAELEVRPPRLITALARQPPGIGPRSRRLARHPLAAGAQRQLPGAVALRAAPPGAPVQRQPVGGGQGRAGRRRWTRRGAGCRGAGEGGVWSQALRPPHAPPAAAAPRTCREDARFLYKRIPDEPKQVGWLPRDGCTARLPRRRPARARPLQRG